MDARVHDLLEIEHRLPTVLLKHVNPQAKYRHKTSITHYKTIILNIYTAMSKIREQ